MSRTWWDEFWDDLNEILDEMATEEDDPWFEEDDDWKDLTIEVEFGDGACEGRNDDPDVLCLENELAPTPDAQGDPDASSPNS